MDEEPTGGEPTGGEPTGGEPMDGALADAELTDEDMAWLGTAFAGFEDSAPSQAWPPADEIGRRAARRRRRRRRIGLVSGSTALLLVAALVVGSVGITGAARRAHRPQPPPGAREAGVRPVAGPDGSVHLVASAGKLARAGPEASSALASAEEAFALDLTRREVTSSPAANVLLSPMSADIDLSMLELGAGGATEKGIATALSSSGLSAGENAAAWKDLVSSEIAGGSPSELTLANSLWLEQHTHVERAYLHQEAAAFGNDTYQVDFASPAATDAINAWADRLTAGRVPALFSPGELPGTTVVVLANALHLHAAWENRHQFVASRGSFETGGGARVSVPTLTAAGDPLRFSVTPAYQAVQIPYSNGRFAALAIEPKPGTMTSWLAGLTSTELGAIVGSLTRGLVDLSMPALHLSSRPLLNTALSAMGMAGAFESADLTPMLGPALGSRVYVNLVQQAATLHVSRWGTDAAAATGISVSPTSTSGRPAQVIDIAHPYLFLIRDTKTGAIVFSSVVQNPATT